MGSLFYVMYIALFFLTKVRIGLRKKLGWTYPSCKVRLMKKLDKSDVALVQLIESGISTCWANKFILNVMLIKILLMHSDINIKLNFICLWDTHKRFIKAFAKNDRCPKNNNNSSRFGMNKYNNKV